MSAKPIVFTCLLAAAAPAPAQVGNQAGSDDHWNISGPAWYDTKCGHVGFSVTHGLPYADKYREPCSVPIRVCEFERLTVNYPADPDVPCDRMVAATSSGELKRTYIKRWD